MADVLALDRLDDDEERILKEILNRISSHRGFNADRARWYEASRTIRPLGASSVRRLSGVETVAGWPGLVVDALEERLNIVGPVVPGATDTELDAIWADNSLEADYSPAHLEALIHGVAFLTASRGGPGDPDPTITVESPRTMSGIWDPVRRRLSAAAAVTLDDDGVPVGATLFLPDETIAVVPASGSWDVVDRDRHGAGRVMAERLVNRTRASRHWGRSEITRPILSYTRAAMRTLVRSEVSSEFFSQPQRWALGVDKNAFTKEDGSPASPWEAYIGFIWALSDPDDPDAQRPSLGEFSSASPTPFIDLVKMYSQLVAGEAALPPTWLGFVTENPASADQIRATEARHVSRAERRQAVFGAAWRQILLDAAALTHHGRVPDALRPARIQWRDAATPTRAAATDAVTKLVASGVLPATSRVTYELLGYDTTTVDRLVADAAAQQARASVAALATGASATARLALAAVPSTEGAVPA